MKFLFMDTHEAAMKRLKEKLAEDKAKHLAKMQKKSQKLADKMSRIEAREKRRATRASSNRDVVGGNSVVITSGTIKVNGITIDMSNVDMSKGLVVSGDGNVVINGKRVDAAKGKSQVVVGDNVVQVGGNMNLGPLKDLETESSMREENAKLKAELSVAERELAMVTKPPSWLSLLKEWFMYKVLKRSKPQPLYLGPYR